MLWYDKSANTLHPQRHGRLIFYMFAGLASTPVVRQIAGRPNDYLIWASWTVATKAPTAFSTLKRSYGVCTLSPRLHTAASLRKTRPLQPVDLMSTWSPTISIQAYFMLICKSINLYAMYDSTNVLNTSFANRDIFMRFRGGGVGHRGSRCYNEKLGLAPHIPTSPCGRRRGTTHPQGVQEH